MASQSHIVDLRSDTVTKPTNSMKHAMVNSALGDDVYGEDPTVNALEGKVAAILGKQAALFVPSGTMANLIATMVHCNKRGAEMLCGDRSHMFKCEQGGASQVAGVTMTTLKNLPDGTFDLEEMESHVRGSRLHEPITMMVAIENTHNLCGGRVLPVAWIDKLAAVAKKHSLVVHLDGARLFNASECLREEPDVLARQCDSVSICFSKGLGAPVGSALAGSYHFISQARRMRKVLGGGMRQAGVLAAAAIVALDEVLPNLSNDHRRALFIAKGIKDLKQPSFTVDVENQQTNIILLKIDSKCGVTAENVVQRLAQVSQTETAADCKTTNNEGIIVKTHSIDAKTVRLVVHLDVNDNDVRLVVKKLAFVLREMECNKNSYK